jgi:hypothetical protein
MRKVVLRFLWTIPAERREFGGGGVENQHAVDGDAPEGRSCMQGGEVGRRPGEKFELKEGAAGAGGRRGGV